MHPRIHKAKEKSIPYLINDVFLSSMTIWKEILMCVTLNNELTFSFVPCDVGIVNYALIHFVGLNQASERDVTYTLRKIVKSLKALNKTDLKI